MFIKFSLLDLYAHQTTATSTVRVNRKGLPEIYIKSKLKNKEICQCRKGPLFCVAYQDGKKKPILLSTVAKAGFTEMRNRRGNIVMKPNAVALYNKTMVGVDSGDAQLYVYLSERKTIKRTTKVAFSLFGRAILNSYLLYKLNTNEHKPMSRIDFMMAIVESLVGDYFPFLKDEHQERLKWLEVQLSHTQFPNILQIKIHYMVTIL